MIRPNFSSINNYCSQTRITDHFQVMISVNLNIDRVYSTTSYSKVNTPNITSKTNLSKINLMPIFAFNDPNNAIECFVFTIIPLSFCHHKREY